MPLGKNHTRSRAGSLPLILAAIQMLQGLVLHGFANRLPAAYATIGAFAPTLATLFVASGVVLLLVFRYGLSAGISRGLLLLPVLPSAVLVWGFAQSGIWLAALHQGGVALLALALAWVGQDPLGLRANWKGSWTFPAIGKLLLVALPLLLAAWSLRNGLLTEALAWTVWTFTGLLGAALPVPVAATAMAKSVHERSTAVQDLSLETWNWMLTFLVVAMAALPWEQVGIPLRSIVFALLVSLYYTSIYLIPWHGAQKWRLRLHLMFMILSMGILVTGPGAAVAGLLSLLVAAVPLAAWALGSRAGWWMLGISVALVTTDTLGRWARAEQSRNLALGLLAIQLLIVLVVGPLGLRMVSIQRRLVEGLRGKQEELDQAIQALHQSEERMTSLLDIAPSAAIAIDVDQRIILFNQKAEEIFGYTSAEAIGHPLDILLPPEAIATHRQVIHQFRSEEKGNRRMGERKELTGRRKDGHLFPVQVAISRVMVGDESICMALVQDMTDQRKTERLLTESEERFRNAFENAPIGVGLLDPGGVWLRVNAELCQMVGYREADLVGQKIGALVHPEDWVSGGDFAAPLREGRVRSVQTERRFVHANGSTVWVQESYSVMRQGGELSYIVQVQEITERKRYEAQLVHMANYDPLTELVNRRHFRSEVERHLAQLGASRGQGGLLFIDVDLFKYVNDTLGHGRGDEVLRQVAIILKTQFRPTDLIARLGGDEFAVLLPETQPDEAVRLVEGLLDSLRRSHIPVGESSIALSVSVGITFFPDHGRTADELLAHADVAMYEAKENGRNGWAIYEPSSAWKREMEEKLAWDRRIREALQQDRFVLHYQPILNLRRNQVTHHELLLRMVGEDGGLVYPTAFLGVAERFGLIQEVDRWVVRKAIQLMAEAQQMGTSPVFEVNLSGKTISDPDLPRLIRAELAAAQVNPAALVFEITETAAIGDLDQAMGFINSLKGLGCQFALDDVGTGFSTIAFLKQLDVDYVKIDGSFIRNLPDDRADQHLVKALAQIARELEKRTIAEFVETPETVQLLREYGVDYAQGYLIGRPGPSIQW